LDRSADFAIASTKSDLFMYITLTKDLKKQAAPCISPLYIRLLDFGQAIPRKK